jgi:kynurenine formamidase
VVTHLDAFGHRFFDGKMYNGFSYEEVTKEDGAKKGSIYSVKGGILTRGVLMDIPRLKGVPYLEPGTRIYPEDLEAWEKKAGVKVMPGDALFVRTGRWTWMKTTTPSPSSLPQQVAGLDASVIPWLKKRDVALLGSEQAQDFAPYRKELPALPVHDFALVMLGVHLFDNTNLDDLAEAAAARRRWEFMLMAAPLRVPGGTGSPLNPIAVF